MSKKKHPITKFRVPAFHPKRGDVDWVVWAADEGAARVTARLNFTTKHGFAPTFVGEPTIYARPRSGMSLSAMLGMVAAVSWDSDPYRRHARSIGGHIFGD